MGLVTCGTVGGGRVDMTLVPVLGDLPGQGQERTKRREYRGLAWGRMSGGVGEGDPEGALSLA